MSPELAALLDGNVAERFGRPTDDADFAMYWSGDGVTRFWVWDDPTIEDCESDAIPDATADALWLAHLLAVCGQLPQRFEICPHVAGCFVRVNRKYRALPDGAFVEESDLEYHHATPLEAIARAMLAVPVTPPPHPAQG